jgi:DeoR/GlpR family transcriptional regulator of sugar metabolism
VSDPDLRCDGALERRAHILGQLRRLGFLSVADLARDLRVSAMTVRRDLHLLEAGGDVRLVHGGATLSAAALHGSVHVADPLSAATRIAALAVASIGPTDTVALDAGPTAFALARCLPVSFEGSVITHSMPVLQLLAECRPDVRVVALGGELSPGRRAFVGPCAETALARLRARTFFLDPVAVDAGGVHADSPGEAGVQRGMMAIADDVVVLAPGNVLAASAPVPVAPLDRLARVLTDRPVPPGVAAALRRAGVAVRVEAPAHVR